MPKKIRNCGLREAKRLLLHSNQDVTNSVRVNLVQDQRQVILFKSEWLYSQLHEFWDSCQNMVASLKAEKDFDGTHQMYVMYGSHYLNIESLVVRHPSTDFMAREIVDLLLTINDHRIQSNDDIFDSLTENTRSYLHNTFSKTGRNNLNWSSSLIKFTEFYPSLFRQGRNGLLELVPLNPIPHSLIANNSNLIANLLCLVNDEEDFVVVKNMCPIFLVKSPDSIIVLDNCDRSVYR